MKNLVYLISVFVLFGCMQDEDLWQRQHFDNAGYSGVFILNEGNFLAENSSVSYLNFHTNSMTNDVFFKANALRLGDVGQSIKIYEDLAYVVMNNSGKIQIMNVDSFTLRGKITGLTSPRDIFFINAEKAYVTDLYASKITIVNPTTTAIIGEINVKSASGNFQQHSTEGVIRWKEQLLVNCWSFDNTILVIDPVEDEVVDSLKVVKQPNSMGLDYLGYLWVLSDGGFEGTPYGQDTAALQRIDLNSKTVKEKIMFPFADSPSDLTFNRNGDTVYFLNKHVYRMAVGDVVPELFIASPYTNNSSGGYRGLAFDKAANKIYVADAKDFISNGEVLIFDLKGNKVNAFEVGVIPSDFSFKNFD